MKKRKIVNRSRNAATSRAARRRLVQTAVFISVTAIILLAVFVVVPAIEESRLRKRLSNALNLARNGPVERALSEFQEIQLKSRSGSDIAERAGREERALLEYVRGARDLRQQADDAYKMEQFETALRLYQELGEKYPLSALGQVTQEKRNTLLMACRAFEAQAQTAAEARQWDIAVDCLTRVIALDPEYPDTQERLATAQSRLAEFDAVMQRASADVAAADWQRARQAYEDALQIIPGSDEAFEGRTSALRQIPPPEGMCLILPGEFRQGPPGDENVSMCSGLYMDAAEVTNADYEKFVAATGAQPPAHWDGNSPSPIIAGLPVVCVSWDDAGKYAEWADKRLPTRLEWERAARGLEGRIYPWGGDFDPAAGVLACGPIAAGALASDMTPEGIWNLGGNVSEWTADAAPAQPSWPPPVIPRFASRSVLPAPLPQRFICGESWAGLESQRPDRIVIAGLANPSNKPADVVYVTMPGLFGVRLLADSEVQFAFTGSSDVVPVITIRKWFPDSRQFVSIHTTIKEGEMIAGSRIIPAGPMSQAEATRVTLSTGCKLIKFEKGDNRRETYIIYEDRYGVKRTIPLTPGQPAPDINELPASDTRESKALKDLIRELSGRSLAESCHPWAARPAPEIGAYRNVGFRCVKDL